MTAEVLTLVTGPVGDGMVLSADALLENNKGEFVKLTLVGQREDGSIAVAGTHSMGDSVILLEWAKHFLVHNVCFRD